MTKDEHIAMSLYTMAVTNLSDDLDDDRMKVFYDNTFLLQDIHDFIFGYICGTKTLKHPQVYIDIIVKHLEFLRKLPENL